MRLGLGELGLCALVLSTGCGSTEQPETETTDGSMMCAECGSGGRSDGPWDAPDASTGPEDTSHDAGADAGLDGSAPDLPDGTVTCPEAVEVKTLDGSGRETFAGLDDDCDGVADRACRGVTYDSAGNPASTWEDGDCDDDHDTCDTYQYDASGQVTRIERRTPCATQPGTLACVVNTYDRYGALTQRMTSRGGCMTAQAECEYMLFDPPGERAGVSESYIDEGCDGTRDRMCTVRTEHLTGRIKYPVVLALDSDCDGTRERGCILEEQTQTGAPRAQAIDDDCDGSGDMNCETWTYDDQDRLTLHETDRYCDGTRVAYERTAYAAEGYAERVDTLKLQSEGTSCMRDFFDETGKRVRSESSSDCAGNAAQSCTDFSYDAEGRLVLEQSARPCSAAPSQCTAYEYDENGRQSLVRETDCEGAVTLCRTTTYDAAGNVLRRASGPDCGGSESHCTAFTYDTNDRVLSERGGPCAGSEDHCVDYEYVGTNPLDVNVRYGCDGMTSCGALRYSDDGRYRSRRGDEDCDGTFDTCLFERVSPVPGDPAFGWPAAFDRDDPECEGFPLAD